MTTPASLQPFLVSAFDQSELIQRMHFDHVRDGFCLMLAVTWVMRSHHHGNPEVAFNEVTTNEGLLRQMANNQSNVFQSKFGLWRGGYDQSMDEITTFMTRNGGASGTLGPILFGELGMLISGKGVVIIQFAVPRWRVLGLTAGTRTAGHAIGVYEHNGDVYIFDPNYGLLRTSTATTEQPLQALWTEYNVSDLWYSKFHLR